MSEAALGRDGLVLLCATQTGSELELAADAKTRKRLGTERLDREDDELGRFGRCELDDDVQAPATSRYPTPHTLRT